jgi:hypothetical protein
MVFAIIDWQTDSERRNGFDMFVHRT